MTQQAITTKKLIVDKLMLGYVCTKDGRKSFVIDDRAYSVFVDLFKPALRRMANNPFGGIFMCENTNRVIFVVDNIEEFGRTGVLHLVNL